MMELPRKRWTENFTTASKITGTRWIDTKAPKAPRLLVVTLRATIEKGEKSGDLNRISITTDIMVAATEISSQSGIMDGIDGTGATTIIITTTIRDSQRLRLDLLLWRCLHRPLGRFLFFFQQTPQTLLLRLRLPRHRARVRGR